MVEIKTYKRPEIICGGIFTDKRGTLRFVNDFDASPVKRIYTVENADTQVIRAWQAHRYETKFFHVVKGRFVIAWVRLDDFTHPSENLKADHAILSHANPEVLVVPGGFANGIRALEQDSVLLVMSDKTLEDSKNDNYRFDPALWFDWISCSNG